MPTILQRNRDSGRVATNETFTSIRPPATADELSYLLDCLNGARPASVQLRSTAKRDQASAHAIENLGKAARSTGVLTWAQRFSSRSLRVFLGFLRIVAEEVPSGAELTIQIFDDDVAALARLNDPLLLLLSATFPYFCRCGLSDADACHDDGNRQTSECNSDAAQSLLPDTGQVSDR